MLTYKELLMSNEWKNKRTEILNRDNYCCLNCRNKRLTDKSQIAFSNKFDFTNINLPTVICTKLPEFLPLVFLTKSYFKKTEIPIIIYYTIEEVNQRHYNNRFLISIAIVFANFHPPGRRLLRYIIIHIVLYNTK